MSADSRYGILAEDLFIGPTDRHQADDGTDGNAHATDARLSAHHAGVTGDTSELRHQCILPVSIVCDLFSRAKANFTIRVVSDVDVPASALGVRDVERR